jgi:hypothetical protein
MKRIGKVMLGGLKMDTGNGLALLQYQQDPVLDSEMHLSSTKVICPLGLGLAGGCTSTMLDQIRKGLVRYRYYSSSTSFFNKHSEHLFFCTSERKDYYNRDVIDDSA